MNDYGFTKLGVYFINVIKSNNLHKIFIIAMFEGGDSVRSNNLKISKTKSVTTPNI